ncbi:MAG: haloacid dehalogenase-like hydrolase [Planctomycetaceae bacterium]
MTRSGSLNADESIKIGVDFDNTIVCYGDLFHSVAVERSLIPPNLPTTRVHVRDYLKGTGRDDAWTELQGYVYGVAISRAAPFPGVRDFFRECRSAGIAISVISHKTRFPVRGRRVDLHAAASEWLRRHRLYDADVSDSPVDAVLFAETRREKLTRIAASGVTHFVDDLSAVLADPAFPGGVRRILFDPERRQPPLPAGTICVGAWDEMGQLFPVAGGRHHG